MSSTLTYSVKNHCSWRKKKEKVPSSSSSMIKWSLDLGFVFFSTPFPVLSYVSCLEAAKPSGRPVEPSVGAVNLLESTHDFPTVKTPGEVSLTSLSLSTSNPRTIHSGWRFETECACSIISGNEYYNRDEFRDTKRSWRKACSRNKDLARSWREWWRESLRVKVWQGSTDLQRGSIPYRCWGTNPDRETA